MSRVVETAQRRFTVEEYHRMAEAGILGPDERVELVRGVVRRMSPKNRAHVITSRLIVRQLENALAGRGAVYQEAPLVAAGIDSEPEPDIMVCSNPDVTAYGTTRSRPLLVIEVADSSLSYGLGEKAALYAEAGVPECWVVDLIERRLVVLRDPTHGRYQVRVSVERSAAVSPQAWPELTLQVSSFFLDSSSNS